MKVFMLSPSASSLGHETESQLNMAMAKMNGGVLSDAVDADCAHACMKETGSATSPESREHQKQLRIRNPNPA
jgi:hypothetical protein